MTDHDLKKAFDALRQSERDSAPSFDAVWRRAKATAEPEQRESRSVVRWVPLAASVIIGALLLFALEREKTPRLIRDARVPAISTWQSPTASLLRSPTQFLTTSTSVMSSVLDGVATAIPTKDLE
jgi:hypothetical protein